MKSSCNQRIISTWLFGMTVLVVIGPVTLAAGPAAGSDTRDLAKQILTATDFHGGVIVDVGCGDGALTTALHAGANCVVQGLTPDADAVAAARRRVQQVGLGGQVTVHRWTGRRLPYIDNLVNLLVIQRPDAVSRDEIMRVLCPNGVAYIKQPDVWRKIVKPRPSTIDDWTHYLHDASNNAVAHDTVVAPPRRMQWNDGPTYSRHHDRLSSVSAVVTAHGRLFEIVDMGSPLSILLPPRWTLTARDAFNGTLLWKRPIQKWFTHLWPLKSGPAGLPRRLVADGDRVYVTMNIDGPLSQLDAVTGKTLQTYTGTKTTEEVILSGGALYLVVNPAEDDEQYAQMAKIRGGYKAVLWDEQPRRIMAIDAASGRGLWSESSVVLPGTLAADNANVVFHDGDRIVCLDARTGQRRWRSEPVPRAKEIRSFYLPTLVLYQDVVLFSGGETAGLQTGSWYLDGKDTMTALALGDGKKLWSAYHPPSGYRSAEDLLVANGLVWTGNTTSGRADGLFTGRDPRTGEVKTEFKPDVSTYWFHHRCYRGKATDNYLLMARAGTEFIDINKQHWNTNYWIRGACLYGIMPANGMLYAPQQPCACYLETKLSGFNAVAPAGTGPRVPAADENAARLERGPLSGDSIGRPLRPGDWPTLRHDAARSGRATTKVPSALNKAWKTTLGGKLTSPVIAAGRLYVASIDDHTVHALDEESGKPLWQFTAGGRVDSPPTIYQGNVMFGSADGYVYCLRAKDGKMWWRFRAAPMDQQLSSYQQLESVWPVHGNVLIQNNILYCVAGRSMFLDSGLRLWRLDPATGHVLSKTVLNERDPASGKTLEQYVSWLNMPPALPDVLSSDGKYVYMRSQPYHLDGTRLPLKPIPHGADADQGAPEPTQDPEVAHLFSPTGFLDGSWWHRTYWMYGSWFVSGWSGYYRSGRVAPAGRIMVLNEDNTVYGFGRKPQYFRWTVPMEYHLFAADKFPPPLGSSRRQGPKESWIEVPKSSSLNPAGKPITVAAWVNTERPGGVIVAHGGGAMGYALYLKAKRPCFSVRAKGKVATATSTIIPMRKWVHVAGVLDEDARLHLYVDGKQVAMAKGSGLLPGDPAEGVTIGSDENTYVGDYSNRYPFGGLMDEVRIYHRALSAQDIRAQAAATGSAAETDGLVLDYTFDNGKAIDRSSGKNNGTLRGVTVAAGRSGKAVRFTGQSSAASNFKVAFHWTQDVPLLARAMVLAGKTLFIAGPPDVTDEDAAYRRADTPSVQLQLKRQLEAVNGKLGGVLWAVSTKDGAPVARYKLDQPPVFDGMAAADGRLFITTIDGSVQCWKPDAQ